MGRAMKGLRGRGGGGSFMVLMSFPSGEGGRKRGTVLILRMEQRWLGVL